MSLACHRYTFNILTVHILQLILKVLFVCVYVYSPYCLNDTRITASTEFMCVSVIYVCICPVPSLQNSYYSVSSVIGTQSRATVHSKCKSLHTAAVIALLLLTHYAHVFNTDITASWLHVGQVLVCLINAPLALPLGQMLVYLLPLVTSQARS